MPKLEVRSDKPPTLEEAQKFVEGYVEAISLGEDQLLVNEEGKLYNLEFNQEATILLVACQGPGRFIVGNALLLKGKARWT